MTLRQLELEIALATAKLNSCGIGKTHSNTESAMLAGLYEDVSYE